MALVAREAAVAHYRRRRVDGRYRPESGLFRSASFTSADNPIAVADHFGDAASRTRPLTVHASIRPAAGANGIVFELGDDPGLAIWVDGQEVGFAAGAQSGDDGVSVTNATALPALAQDVYHLTFSVIPQRGLVTFWRDGLVQGRAVSASATFNGAAFDDGDGAVGAVATAVTTRVPAGQRVTLANAEIVGGVAVYLGQTPRQLHL